METYVKAIEKDITKALLQHRKKHYDNLMKEERQALSSLRAKTDIVIKKADKGSATVVMSREDYIFKFMCPLDDREHYRKLNEDPTIIFLQEIETYLSEMVSRHSIDEETARSLIRDEASFLGLYFNKNSQTWKPR